MTLSTRITLFHEKISRISRYTAGATARCRTTQLELFISYLYLSAAAAEPLRRAVTEQQAILSHVRIILLSPFQRRDQSQSHRVPFSQGLLRVASRQRPISYHAYQASQAYLLSAARSPATITWSAVACPEHPEVAARGPRNVTLQSHSSETCSCSQCSRDHSQLGNWLPQPISQSSHKLYQSSRCWPATEPRSTTPNHIV